MKKSFSLIMLLYVFLNVHSQHCEPILQSYIKGISFATNVSVNNDLKISFRYSRTGGPVKDAYQIYFILFPEEKEKELLSEIVKSVKQQKNNYQSKDSLFQRISPYTKLIHSGILKNQYPGKHPGNLFFSHYLSNKELHELFKEFEPDELLRQNKWFKFYVFIPFLSSEYSDLKALPRDGHDCNAAYQFYMVSEILPYKICFKKYGWIEDLYLPVKND